jgi:hypothetical protein
VLGQLAAGFLGIPHLLRIDPAPLILAAEVFVPTPEGFGDVPALFALPPK